MAGGIFFLLNRPRGSEITITVASPTPTNPAKAQDSYSTPTKTPESQRININLASAQLLADALPGIGAVKAQAIVDYRNQKGPFRRTDELMKVPGIGDAIYQRIKDLVTVGDTP